MYNRPWSNVESVENLKFESALVKVQKGDKRKCLQQEKSCAAPTRPFLSVSKDPAGSDRFGGQANQAAQAGKGGRQLTLSEHDVYRADVQYM